MTAQTQPGIVTLVTDALGRTADLLQTEVRLARAEVVEKAEAFRATLVSSIVMMLVGTIFLIAALVLVLQAVAAALINGGMAPHWAILIVAGGSAVGGAALLFSGKKLLGNVDPTPVRTINSLQSDARMAKEKMT